MLDSAVECNTGATLRVTKKKFQEEELPHKSLFAS